jgi:hypothetical protein
MSLAVDIEVAAMVMNPRSMGLYFVSVLGDKQFTAADPLLYACAERLPAAPVRQAPTYELVNLTEVIHGAADTMNRALKAIEHIHARDGLLAVA